jgi:hypothetical protein
MGGSCNNCNHRCCINGESGILVYNECEICGKYMQLCSNELTDKELLQRCNGEACGCADTDNPWICDNCRE